MQLNWIKEAEKIPITILTPPAEVFSFIKSMPGLFEMCISFPTLVAEYAPQLTIPTMGYEFEEIFEEEYQKSVASHIKERTRGSISGTGLTINGKTPLCDEEWALRHPSFGDYGPSTIAGAYFTGGMFGPEVSPFSQTDHIFWLLSNSSSWLPDKIRSYLIEGMKEWGAWEWPRTDKDIINKWPSCGALWDSLWQTAEDKPFRLTKKIKDDIYNRIELSISRIKLFDSVENIYNKFIAYEFPKSYIEVMIERKNKNNKK